MVTMKTGMMKRSITYFSLGTPEGFETNHFVKIIFWSTIYTAKIGDR